MDAIYLQNCANYNDCEDQVNNPGGDADKAGNQAKTFPDSDALNAPKTPRLSGMGTPVLDRARQRVEKLADSGPKRECMHAAVHTANAPAGTDDMCDAVLADR